MRHKITTYDVASKIRHKKLAWMREDWPTYIVLTDNYWHRLPTKLHCDPEGLQALNFGVGVKTPRNPLASTNCFNSMVMDIHNNLDWNNNNGFIKESSCPGAHVAG